MMPRALAMPPAATTGTPIRSTTWGTREKVPVSDPSDGRRKEPRCPPASKLEATTTSTPASSNRDGLIGRRRGPDDDNPCFGIPPGSPRAGCHK